MKVLVIGAGFLGTEICNILQSNKLEFIPTTRTARQLTINNNQFTSTSLDVLDQNSYSNLPTDITHIIYCVSANSSAVKDYHDSYYLGIKNTISFANQNLQSLRKFTFISSTGVYKENNGNEVTENSEVLINDQKYSSILNAEKEVLDNFKSGGLVLRLSGIYGPGRDYFVRQALGFSEGTEYKIGWTNRIHKLDAARALFHLWNFNESGIFIVSDSEPSLNIDTLNYLRKLSGQNEISTSIDSSNISGKKCKSTKLTNTYFSFMYPSYREGYAEMLGK